VKQIPTLSDRIDQTVFNYIYSRSLVYNTCWEDPSVDRQALQLTPTDSLLVITSAGCNVLDYALDGPRAIHAVDANPRQTALLELKLAGIRALAYEDFFRIFGKGSHPDFARLYQQRLREQLSPFARQWWDQRQAWFLNSEYSQGTFFYRGLSGSVARSFRAYLALRPRLRESIDQLFAARSIEEQRAVYDSEVKPLVWSRAINWALSRQVTMSMLGVPHPQRKEVVAQHAGGVAGFVRESLEYVLRELPLTSNYFYSVYVRGGYSTDCCPEYLMPNNFERLKAGLVDCIQPHTTTVTAFLQGHEEHITRYVLLDHMDWMAGYHPEALVEEWHAILARAAPSARILFRSAHAQPAYLQGITVDQAGTRLREVLRFHDDWARELTRKDRVHTYAGFHIADVCS
jgi:S-adenosylmethionine-diacylglycerol 3-amino-3-carboxypropyl transferase